MRLIHLPVKGARAVRVIRCLKKLSVRDCYLVCARGDVLLARGLVIRKIITGEPVVIFFRLALRPDLRGLTVATITRGGLRRNKVETLFRHRAIFDSDRY